jgi:hydrogenase expression/formation protein HypE
VTVSAHSSVSEREQRVLDVIAKQRARRPKLRDPHITMAHGAGGKATQTLIEGVLVPAFASPVLDALADVATIEAGGVRLAFTTDSFVVKPLRFPGGSIGELAVNGTVNDLAMGGARPLALSLAMILEEGLATDVLRAEVEAIALAARAAGVEVMAGDTKVVERGHADSMYLCTTGIGLVDERAGLAPSNLRPGDRVLVSGSIGEHGTAIMLARGEFELDADVESDTRPLWPAVDALLGAAGPHLRCLRDATRGGVASVLNELARASEAAIVVRERDIPVRPAVAGAAELLGIDPLYIANEGTFVAFVAPGGADAALAALRAVPGCEDAVEIGEVRSSPAGMVLMETAFGGKRVVDQLVGDPLPRIC